MYNVSLKSETSASSAKYYVNGEEVKKAIYDGYYKFWKNIEKCTPCYLITLNQEDIPVFEGVQFTDCGVGTWIAYYENGTIKETGQFKENHTGNWSNIYNRGFCNVKVGEWKYFDRVGKLIMIEKYENGKLIK